MRACVRVCVCVRARVQLSAGLRVCVCVRKFCVRARVRIWGVRVGCALLYSRLLLLEGEVHLSS